MQRAILKEGRSGVAALAGSGGCGELGGGNRFRRPEVIIRTPPMRWRKVCYRHGRAVCSRMREPEGRGLSWGWAVASNDLGL